MSEEHQSLTRAELLKLGGAGAAGLGLYLSGGSALAARMRSAAAGSTEGVTLNWLTWFDHYFPQQLTFTKKKTGIGCRTKLAPSDSQIYTTIRTTGSQFDIAAMDALWVPKAHKDGLTESFEIGRASCRERV